VLRDDVDGKQRAPARKILVRQDEMAEFFGNLDRYNAGGKGGADRGAYLRLYNGGRYTVDRIGRGTFAIPNWSGCFLGGTQPGPIQRIAKASDDDGMLQRLMYIVPGEQPRGKDIPPCKEGRHRYASLFPSMARLYPPRDMVVTFEHEAHQHREVVDNMAYVMERLGDTSQRLRSAFGKWPGQFARLALTFHLIDTADADARNETGPVRDVISAETAKRAAAFMLDIVLPHLLRADALMFATTQTKHVERVGGWIILNGQPVIKAREIVRAYRPLIAPEAAAEFKAVMDKLTGFSWVQPVIPANMAEPIRTWHVNPRIFTMFPDRAEKERERRREAVEAIAKLKAAHAASE
jgi:Protein of unknown function (DUF3987)